MSSSSSSSLIIYLPLDSEETDISGNQDDMMEASEDLDDESTPEVTSEQTGSDSETTQ